MQEENEGKLPYQHNLDRVKERKAKKYIRKYKESERKNVFHKVKMWMNLKMENVCITCRSKKISRLAFVLKVL